MFYLLHSCITFTFPKLVIFIFIYSNCLSYLILEIMSSNNPIIDLLSNENQVVITLLNGSQTLILC